MEKLKELTSKKILTKIIVLCIILTILLGGIIIFRNNFIITLKGACEVGKLSDVEKCSGKFSKIKLNKVYDTEFSLIINGKTLGQFIDIEIENKSLIAILQNDNAKNILANSTNKYAYGKLEIFSDSALKEGYTAIIDNYIKKFGGNATDEAIKNAFTSVQLNGYNYQLLQMQLPVYLLTFPMLIVLVLIAINIKRKIAINIKGISDVDYDLLEQQIDNNYLYKSLELIITPTYFVSLKSSNIFIDNTDQLFLIYEKSDKLHLCFKSKFKRTLCLNMKAAKKVSEVLMEKNPTVLKGRSKENIKEWENLLLGKNK